LSVLVDAMIVIALHEHDAWDQVIDKCGIAVSSIIAYDEARFHSQDPLGFSRRIDLPGEIAAGRITELSAPAGDMARCRDKFDSVLAPLLHAGELECLALLTDDANDKYSFCTAEKAALLAVALLGLGDRCMSLEALLKLIGLQKPLSVQYTDAWMKDKLDKGRESRMYGQGLSF
jgi:hypothetical protein